MSIFLYLLYLIQWSTPQHSTYIVSYNLEIHKVKQGAELPKVEVPAEYKEAIGKDSIDIFKDIMNSEYMLNVEFTVNPKGEYLIKQEAKNSRFQLGNNFIKYYKGGKFYIDKVVDSNQTMNLTYKKSNEKKAIIGYTCVKFIGRNNDTNETYEIWATQQLPGSITALYRLPQFGYAVLEISSKSGGWKQTAYKVLAQEAGKDIFNEMH